MIDVYDDDYLKTQISQNDFLKSYVTNIFQNHGSISLYITSDIFNGYIQINRETKKIVEHEIPAAHSTRDLQRLIDRLISLKNFLDSLQDELNKLPVFKTFIENYIELSEI